MASIPDATCFTLRKGTVSAEEKRGMRGEGGGEVSRDKNKMSREGRLLCLPSFESVFICFGFKSRLIAG